jgi:hypothetical protein
MVSMNSCHTAYAQPVLESHEIKGEKSAKGTAWMKASFRNKKVD